MNQKEKNLEEVIRSCGDCGRQLNNPVILGAAEYAKGQLVPREKLNVTVVGTESAALGEVWSTLTGEPPAGSIPSGCLLRAVSPEMQDSGEEPVLVSSAPLFKRVDLRFVYSRNGYMDMDWPTVFAATDCLILTFSAVQLLTRSERSFVEDRVRGGFGLDRLTLLLTGTDMIQREEDLELALQRLKQYAETLGGGCTALSIEDETLPELVGTSLPDRVETLRDLRLDHAAALCLAQTQSELTALRDSAGTDLDQVEALREECEKRADKLRRSGRHTASDAESAVSVNLYYTFRQALEKYGAELSEQAAAALAQAEESELAGQAVKVLAYLQQSWSAFIRRQSERLQQDVENYIVQAYQMAEQDAEAALLSLPEQYDDLLGKALPLRIGGPDIGGQDISGGYGTRSDRIKKLSKALLVGAVPAALILGPAATLAMAAGSLAIKKFYLPEIGAEALAAMQGKARESCAAMAEAVDGETRAYLKRAAGDVRESVEKIYESLAARLTDELADYRDKVRQNRDRLRELEAFSAQLSELTSRIS